MNRYDDAMMSRTAGASSTTIDRRDFLKLTSTGLLVHLRGRAAARRARSRRGVPGGPPGLPDRPQRLPAHRRRRPRHVLRRQDRDGPGRDDVAAAARSPRSSTSRSTSVDIVMGDTDLCPWDMGTFGSLSIRQFGPVLRAAAAEAKARPAAAGGRAAAGAAWRT